MALNIRPAGLATADRRDAKKGAFGTHPSNSQNKRTVQAAIRAELAGSDTCTAPGLTVRGASPILEMCRRLIEAGHAPDRPLHCYRGDGLVLSVSSIAIGAQLRVRGNGAGFEIIPTATCPTAPPVRATASVAIRMPGARAP
jgi:hypothetical protein